MLEGVFFSTIKSLEKWIRLEETGSPEEFAEKLNISVTLLYYYLQSLKEMSVPIAYNKEKRTFYFKEPGQLNEHFLWTRGVTPSDQLPAPSTNDSDQP